MRKQISLLTLVCIITCSSQAQFYKTIIPSSTAFADSLSVILNDYQHNFYHVQGDKISAEKDVDVYQSQNNIPGTTDCLLFRFHSAEDTTASWQAIIYKGEDYKQALKAYKHCYQQVKKTNFKIGDNSLRFTGSMELPSESLRFTTSTLTLINAGEMYKNFAAEIELIQVYTDWEVRLNLRSKKQDEARYNY